MSTLWTKAVEHVAMPWLVHQGEEHMAGAAKHVKDAGFAGFVQHPSYERTVKSKTHESTDWDAWHKTEPEPTSHDFAHFDEHGTFSPEHHKEHLKRYFDHVQKEQDRDTPDHTDHHLIAFQRSDALFGDTWRNHGEKRDIGIKGPVYATQSHVNQAHIDRYSKAPDDKSWHEQTTGRPAGDYQGGHHPLFVTHQGRLHVIEGHHRVAAALQRGDTHIHGWHINLDDYHKATGGP